MNRLIVLLILNCPLILNAQNLFWAKEFKTADGSLTCNSTVVDSAGNIYMTGFFYGTVDFDPGSNVFNLTAVANDAFFCKFNSSGNLLWAERIGGNGSETGAKIIRDSHGDFYMIGYASDAVDFDPGPGVYTLAAYSGTTFICKLDQNGSFIWAKVYGANSFMGSFNIFFPSITIDNDGNLFLTGGFSGEPNFDPDGGNYYLTSVGGNDSYVMKLNPSGSIIWLKQFGGTSNDNATDIKIDGSGNLIITGFFNFNCDFDPGAGTSFLTSNGQSDIFVLKLTSSGDFIWVKQLGGDNYDYGNDITLDASDNIYMTGTFQHTVDFDPGIPVYNLTAVSIDMFLWKLDKNGSFIWAKKISSPGGTAAGEVIRDTEGNIYLAGAFAGTADFDPGAGTFNLTSATSDANDWFILMLDSATNFMGAARIGGTGNDAAGNLILDAGNNMIVTGTIRATTDMDPGVGVFNLSPLNIQETVFLKLRKFGSSALCANSNNSFTSNLTGTSYQWMVNSGSGFNNITNNSNYSGANTAILQLTGIPSSWYGYQYKCLVDGFYSTTFTIRILDSWTGNVDTNWNNPLNWECNSLPDAGTDVIVGTGLTNYPVINSNSAVKNLDINQGASLKVNAGFNLTITGN